MPSPTDAKLVPEAASGAPAAPATSLSDRDADASAAVEAALKDLGTDRSALEGEPTSVVIPPAPGKGTPPAKPAAPAAPAKPAAGDTPPRGEDGKFLKKADDGQAPPAEPQPKTPAAPAAAAPAAAAAPSAEEALGENLTAEELAEIEKNPLAKKAYKSVVRAMNKKFAELAEQRKGHEQDLDIMATVRQNPIAGIQALAQVAGVKVAIGAPGTPAAPAAPGAPAAPAKKTPMDLAVEKLSGAFTPEGAKVLAPILVEIAEAVAASKTAELRPDIDALRHESKEVKLERAKGQLNEAVRTYARTVEARGDDWSPEIEAGIASLIPDPNDPNPQPGKVIPAPGTTIGQYLDFLYDRVTAERSRQAVKQRQLTRLRAATEVIEPTHAVRSTPNRASDQQITAGMSDEDATALAIAQTLEELRG